MGKRYASNASFHRTLSTAKPAVNTTLVSTILPDTIAVQDVMIREGISQMAPSKKKIETKEVEIVLTTLSNGDVIESINEMPIENPIPTPKEETKMFFTFDEKEAGGFDLLPAGDYEAIISVTELTQSTAGNDMINVTLTIRNDVDQEGQKRKIFDRLVASEKAMFKFHQLAKALQWGQGEGAANLEEFAERIIYQQVKIKLKITPPKDGYAAKNEVVTYLVTDYATGDNGVGGPESPYAFEEDGKPIDISDDDLPF